MEKAGKCQGRGWLGRAVWLLALLGVTAPVNGDAQVFLASQAGPEFLLGPLFVRASVAEPPAVVTVDLLWSLVIPPGRTATRLEGDLALLWPSGVRNHPELGRPDPTLPPFMEARGFTVIDEGRVPLFAQSLYQMTGELPAEPVAGGAAYVTVVRQGGPLGLTPPVTYVRIPWTPKLVNRTWQMDLRLTPEGVVRPKKASWIERVFWGPRHIVSLTFGDVRQPAVFPLYFEHREHVVRLSDDPSQLIVNFAGADVLRIDAVSPPTATRQLSQSLENTEVVSVFLDAESRSPQVLTVDFAYFRGLRSWMPVVIPMLFFVLGNAAAPLVRYLVARGQRALAARVDVGRESDRPRRQTGVVLPREVIARIVPGATTYDEVLRLCGPDVEEQEHLDGSGRRRLVYRGRRVVPQRRRRFGWLSTVSRWDIEHHEVEIDMEGGVVRDVQARLRRARLDEDAARS
jgi:hypothetical protein